MAWLELIGKGLLAVAAGAYALTRKAKKDASADDAAKEVEAIYKRATKFAREELARRDTRIDELNAEILDLRNALKREVRVFQSVSRATVRDLQLINSGRIPEERFETTRINVDGMGPLD